MEVRSKPSIQEQDGNILQMSAWELEHYLQELAQENPVIELEERHSPVEQDIGLLEHLRWLNETDDQNRHMQSMTRSETDPMGRVSSAGGLEETLVRFISRQLDRKKQLDKEQKKRILYLASCLDESGYFRVPLEELAGQLNVPKKRMQEALALLQTLEPAGVGAEDLRQCLALQLERIGEDGPALEIVRCHLEELARHQYQEIADQLHISIQEVEEAEITIQELEPRPGAIFQPERITTQYIVPDVLIQEQDGQFAAVIPWGDRPAFQISAEYRQLLAQSEDAEVRSYLEEKLGQAEQVLQAVDWRRSILQSCARMIAERQRDFFRPGTAVQMPISVAEAARQLQVPEATIRQAIREKYLQCSRGIVPLHSFFFQPESGTP